MPAWRILLSLVFGFAALFLAGLVGTQLFIPEVDLLIGSASTLLLLLCIALAQDDGGKRGK